MVGANGGLAERFERLVRLTDDERDALSGLESEARVVPRAAVLQRERDDTANLWVLRSGWAACALGLPDGGRQIIQVHLPGDLVGLACLGSARASETLFTLTEATLACFPRAALGQLIGHYPRLGAIILAVSQIERRRIGERLATIGRMDARTRLACLLVELLERVRDIGLGQDGRFQMPMTQEEIGDTLGLTAVHVNRMLRVLADDGLIAREGGGQIRILDEGRLCRFAGQMERERPIDLGWLPAARAG